MVGSKKLCQVGGGTDNVIFFTEDRMKLPRNAIGAKVPIASRGGSVPVLLRKPIATCDFTGVVRTPCPPLDPPMSHHTNAFKRLEIVFCTDLYVYYLLLNPNTHYTLFIRD